MIFSSNPAFIVMASFLGKYFSSRYMFIVLSCLCLLLFHAIAKLILFQTPDMCIILYLTILYFCQSKYKASTIS